MPHATRLLACVALMLLGAGSVAEDWKSRQVMTRISWIQQSTGSDPKALEHVLELNDDRFQITSHYDINELQGMNVLVGDVTTDRRMLMDSGAHVACVYVVNREQGKAWVSHKTFGLWEADMVNEWHSIETMAYSPHLTGSFFPDKEFSMIYCNEDKLALVAAKVQDGSRLEAVELPFGRFMTRKHTVNGTAPDGDELVLHFWFSIEHRDVPIQIEVRSPGGTILLIAQGIAFHNPGKRTLTNHESDDSSPEAPMVLDGRDIGEEKHLPWKIASVPGDSWQVRESASPNRIGGS